MKIGFIYTDSRMLSQARQIMALCTEKGAIDELGVGRIRDMFSNTLFPGISSLQTRAKYFTVLPLIYEEMANMEWRNAQDVRDGLRSRDKRLARLLLDTSKGTETGIVGSALAESGKMVKYDASYIYWSGMKTFGIIDDPSGQSVARLILEASRKRRETDTTEEEAIGQQRKERYWEVPSNRNWEDGCSIRLTREEADFLRLRICDSPAVRNGNTLLAPLLESTLGSTELKGLQFEDLPIVALDLPEETRRIYTIARDFADFIHGLYLRYNVLLARIVDNFTGEVTTCDTEIGERFDTWVRESWEDGGLRDRAGGIWDWLSMARLTDRSGLAFCRMAAAALDKGDGYVALDKLVTARERSVKQSRRKIGNPEYYRFEPGHYIHDYLMDYRWTTARQIIADIKEGEIGHE